MYINKIKHILLFFALTALVACEAEIDQYTPDPGQANLTTFVAVGNSLVAGFADGDLYRSGQENSLANIIAGQLMHTGLGSFKQPLMKDELGFGNRLVLAEVEGSLMPVPMPGTPDPANFANIYQTEGPFHNLGVPLAKVSHLFFEGYGALNPYYGRFASNPAASTVISDAAALDPTFFQLWIGHNDILGYATSGGEGDGITPAISFMTMYLMAVEIMTHNGAKGVLGNIADITSIPFFQTVPYNALLLDDQNIVDLLNHAYSAAPHINFILGPNPLVVADNDHPAGLRQLEAGELVLLTALGGIRNDGWGSQVPLPAQYYLNLDQIENIAGATDEYNQTISMAAETFGLAYVDIRSVLAEAEHGIYFDAIGFNTEFVTGGVFSLDGIHLSARGNAIVANEFIAAINRKYNASIPKATIGSFPGIVFP